MWNFIVMENVYQLLIDVMINLIVVSILFKNLFEISDILDDGADEPFDCINVTCPHEYFKCSSSGRCIPFEKVCDNLEDCPMIDRINGLPQDETSQACSMKESFVLKIKLG
jgi:hypothetical protein